MLNRKILAITSSFLLWRIALFIVAFISIYIFPVFGNRFPYVDEILKSTNLPYWIWGFGNFDGVHYLNISSHSYSAQYTQAFFPLYPLSIWFVNIFMSNSLISALLISNVVFLATLYLLFKLFQFDFSEKVSFRSIILLLAFPTAFYFGSIYTESLFLFLTVSCLLFMRQKNFLLAAILASLASATKIIGVVLFFVLLIEICEGIIKNRKISKKEIINLLVLAIAPLGLLAYMIYLQMTFGNPLYFLSAQPSFGAGRSISHFVLLPQVVLRYLKIFASVPWQTQTFFIAFLEFIFTLGPLTFLLFYLKKIRLSYSVLILLCFLIPTFTGTLLSMPRFALMGFLLLPYLARLNAKIFYSVTFLFIVLQCILLMMFMRGYWVA